MRFTHHEITVSTTPGIGVFNITSELRAIVENQTIMSGFAAVASRHTTTAVTVNEDEERLFEDTKRFLAQLVPANAGYLHNDIHLRDCPPDEPQNAHSHILAMLLGSSETIAISQGRLALGKWQSVLLIELDGPRTRSVNVMICGE